MKKLITILVILIGATVKGGSGTWSETTYVGNNKETKVITRTFILNGKSKKQITTVVTNKYGKKATVKTKVKNVKKFKSIKVIPNGKKKKKTEDGTYED